MDIRIYSSLSQFVPLEKTAGGQTSTKVSQDTVSSAKVVSSGHLQVDSTTLSSAFSLISRALAEPDVRTAKVAAIQQALAEGSYKVGAEDVAGKLIDHLLDR